jgi:CRISPR-associated endonuclease/helicase Cas3
MVQARPVRERELAKTDGVDYRMTVPNQWLREALGLPEGDTPFPWQEELFTRFVKGRIERSLDIPTGLGKTAVMAIWLVARACGAKLPRRLVYVVDRHAVVDQATEVAKGLRGFVDCTPELREKLGLGDRSLPISTLRGQYVDNREWLEDPASPAIIVGTVDMIGSRLLFEGYGTSRKMRPYHAGLLGADTLVVLDEAHLVPPFEKLLEAIADGAAMFGPRDETLREIVPSFKLLSLSATGRAHSGESFGLQEADLDHPVVRQRLDAPKRLTVLPPFDDERKLEDALAEQAWKLAGNGTSAVRCIVFCDSRKVASAVKKAIDERTNGDKKVGSPKLDVPVELFVGGRRVFEREEAANRLKALGFIAGNEVARTRPAFVIATSAGEVGVDLDADHMVSDLVAWERMVQRLGRVNRRGDGEANVIVVVEPEPEPKKIVQDALAKNPSDWEAKEVKAVAAYQASIALARAIRKPLDRLPLRHGAGDASTGALRALKLSAKEDPELQAILDAATTSAPLRPALSRALVDAWSMTSLEEHTGRPEIDPWLRGWIKDDRPQTAVVWRTHLPARTCSGRMVAVAKKEIETFFEAAPPHASEVLETETFLVVGWLTARALALMARSNDKTSTAPDDGETNEVTVEGLTLHPYDVVAVVLTRAGDRRRSFRLVDLTLPIDDKEAAKKTTKDLERTLAGTTIVVDARMAGLTDGLLSDKADGVPRTCDDGDEWIPVATVASSEAPRIPIVGFRVRNVESGQHREGGTKWRECLRLVTEVSDDDDPVRCLIVENAATEERRSAGPPQLIDEHQEWAEKRARRLARELGLPDLYAAMLAVTASVHDEGKRTDRWQRAFNAKMDGQYAKTGGPINYARLEGYRHEFGSVPVAARTERLRALPDDLSDLALHLIAAHHGFARPVIGTNGCDDLPQSAPALEERAREVALRFARLQKRWGPWGLAWWESLLRAADQQASRDNDNRDSSLVRRRSYGKAHAGEGRDNDNRDSSLVKENA